ncbi:MAG: hypothetical protein U0904_05855 [Candidatus Nanopelagicales bacterium]|nr:hypothetical protein [Candidatus Nanopelagicales bacterium]
MTDRAPVSCGHTHEAAFRAFVRGLLGGLFGLFAGMMAGSGRLVWLEWVIMGLLLTWVVFDGYLLCFRLELIEDRLHWHCLSRSGVLVLDPNATLRVRRLLGFVILRTGVKTLVLFTSRQFAFIEGLNSR